MFTLVPYVYNNRSFVTIYFLQLFHNNYYFISVHSDIYTLLQKGVGEFEVNLESVTLASGQIKQIHFGKLINFKPKERFVEEPSTEINHKDIYKYLKEFSVEFEDSFKLIQKVSFNDAGKFCYVCVCLS